jgi:trimethylamine---corrinoid protein Co-methyltransferase
MCPQGETILEKGILLEKKAHFTQAKAVYEDILQHACDEPLLEKVRLRIEDIDDLIAEKAVYQRINENAKRVLTEIGMNIAGNEILLDILLEADALDLDSETALFIPLKRSFVDHCLEQVPREMPGDPGRNAFGTGATSPFLKRVGEEELRPANRRECEKITRLVAEHQDVVRGFARSPRKVTPKLLTTP